ncbi:MAG TPA: hypothetical protein VKM54_08870, partial [Myxococcota bacterium]|nr:hypothetical protein [Myxococcota bacterium]
MRHKDPPWLFTKEDEAAYQAVLAVASNLRTGEQLPYEWAEVCEEPPAHVATALVSLASTGTLGAEIEALRDTART